MPTTRLENTTPPHLKYYEVVVEEESGGNGYRLKAYSGRMRDATSGRAASHVLQRENVYADMFSARREVADIVTQKVRGGYHVVRDDITGMDAPTSSVRREEAVVREYEGQQRRHIRRRGGRAFLAGNARIIERFRTGRVSRARTRDDALAKWTRSQTMRSRLRSAEPHIRIKLARQWLVDQRAGEPQTDAQATAARNELKQWLYEHQRLNSNVLESDRPANLNDTYVDPGTGGYNNVLLITKVDGLQRIGSVTFDRQEGVIKRFFIDVAAAEKPTHLKKAVALLEHFVLDTQVFSSGTNRETISVLVPARNTLLFNVFEGLGYELKSATRDYKRMAYKLQAPSVVRTAQQRYYFDERV